MVHRYTRTRILSLHWSSPGNGIKTVSLWLNVLIIHQVFTGRILTLIPPRTQNWRVVPFVFKKTLLHQPHGKKPSSIVVDEYLQLRCLVIDFLQIRVPTRLGPHRECSFPSIAASICAYRAAAWQPVDQIRYNIVVLPSSFVDPLS
jgi:hypothetical protein